MEYHKFWFLLRVTFYCYKTVALHSSTRQLSVYVLMAFIHQSPICGCPLKASLSLKWHSEAILVLTLSYALVTRRICRPTGDGTDLVSVSSDPGSVLKQKVVMLQNLCSQSYFALNQL